MLSNMLSYDVCSDVFLVYILSCFLGFHGLFHILSFVGLIRFHGNIIIHVISY